MALENLVSGFQVTRDPLRDWLNMISADELVGINEVPAIGLDWARYSEGYKIRLRPLP